jgi:predicted GNAT family acetyltransferase
VTAQPSESAAVSIRDVPDESRYVMELDREPAGFAEYRLRPGAIVFMHTVVDPAFEGRGLGSRIAKFVLDDARRRGLAVVPACPFIRSYIESHPDYRDLIPEPKGDAQGR